MVIYSGGKDLLTLINDILDLSKVEAGKLQVDISTVDIKKVCNNIERQFQPLAHKEKFEFKIEIDKGIPNNIKSDEQRLIQVIRNLLSNAFKFTEKGSVKLKISKPDHEIDLPLDFEYSYDELIAWSVADTGIGIPSDKQQEIFEAFHQAEGSTSRKFGGTGLGLAISRAMSELLGGTLTLESKEGKGSVFTLYLPLNIEETVLNDKRKEPEKIALPELSKPKPPIKTKPIIKQIQPINTTSDGNTLLIIGR